MVETGVSFEDELILCDEGELESALAEEKGDAVSAEGSVADADEEHEKRKKAMMGDLLRRRFGRNACILLCAQRLSV